jgi:8-oxo-dGTP pyrophosphatase MutT (NUDIX family)
MSKINPRKSWKVFSRKVEHKNPWFQIVREDVRKPNGFRGDYFIFEGNSSKDFVIVIVRDCQGKDETFYLVKQWRPTLKRYLIEFAAGSTGKQESFLQAAKREVKEELGLEAKDWRYIGKATVAPGHSMEYGRVFVATNALRTKHEAKGDPGETTQLVKVSRKQFERMIYNKQIQDGPTLSAFLLYLVWKKEL